MFFDSLDQISLLAKNSGFAIFVVENDVISPVSNLKTAKTPKNFFEQKSVFVAPVKPDTGKIGIDEVRELIDHCKIRQNSPHFVVIENGGALTIESQDALLKLLEEPKENYHFVIFAANLENLLETVRSRASIFIHKSKNITKTPPKVDEETLKYAKKLLTLSPRDVISFEEELTNPKLFKKPREEILKIVQTAIELAYKSYFITKNDAFIAKIP